MADIDLVPKHRSATWIWWVVLAAVVILALFWMMSNRGSTTRSSSLVSPHHDARLAQVTSCAGALS